MSLPLAAVARQALSAYAGIDNASTTGAATAGGTPVAANADFSGMVSRALGEAVTTGQTAETRSVKAIAGGGDLTQVVTAVSRAELALQTTIAIRDRVVQAYQEIIRMPI